MQSKKTIGFLIKIGIVAFALFFLYQQLTSKSSIEEFDIDHILVQLKQNYLVIFLVIFDSYGHKPTKRIKKLMKRFADWMIKNNCTECDSCKSIIIKNFIILEPYFQN